ncbi:monoheme cytochrome C [Polaribacter sp. SA4-12]|uniref:monoheme cytochrome C n=1 Tax=Polaribacter sp. SA4-12 TaxID=1312072 RepID=UPI000B3D1ADB|nr:monoheme cytochrome C [Polaribacter sp. SA4-12]ARV15203.1 monoheme cytochrome C [Polaribacter sp. SA4-12]
MTEDKEFLEKIKKAKKTAYYAIFFSLIASVLLLFAVFNPSLSVFENKNSDLVYNDIEEDDDKIENGIHLRTGLVDAEGLMTVVNNCTNCHSAKLVTQNRMNAERWNETIKWMQKTQNLWDLGENQKVIVNYLVVNYPPIAKGRRMILKDIDWYKLEN